MPAWALAPVSPVSVGIALPDNVVSNARLCEDLDSTPAWIEEKTGIKERRFLDTDENITGLATQAAANALANADIAASDIDVLVVACTSPDWLMPSLGVMIATELSITTPRIIDITQHACSSSVYAIYTAACMLQEEGLENALVVGAECISRNTDPNDRRTRVFFGDAAAATVLRKGGATGASEGLLGYDLGSSLSHAVAMASPSQLCHERATMGREVSPRYLRMDGRVVWQEATTQVPKSINDALAASQVDVHQVNAFALHQASAVLVRHITASMGIDKEKVAVTAEWLGNTAAASPLTALWQLARDGRTRRGDHLVISAIGAGFLWGSLCFKLPNDIVAEG
ncbi:ketoacyl-ACP synthase III [Nocardiopsis rhodophaea]|uniref:Ketoacyl-ACP synthase III n=1 Tax=Nocardiopsis rhodophaea TaxID=280238 RepID=A0ABP5F020_9ACTN